MGQGVPLVLPGTYHYNVTSEPEGADIYFNGTYKGKAPLRWERSLLMQTYQIHRVEARKPGYKDGYVVGSDYGAPKEMVNAVSMSVKSISFNLPPIDEASALEEKKADPIFKAIQFKLRPIDISAINYADYGYKNEQDWLNEWEGVPKEAYFESIQNYFDLMDIEHKKVVMVGPVEEINEGIIVEVRIKEITIKRSFMNPNKYDEFLCSVQFIDAKNKKVLFDKILMIDNKDLRRGFGGLSYSTRYKSAAHNIARYVTSIMIKGTP